MRVCRALRKSRAGPLPSERGTEGAVETETEGSGPRPPSSFGGGGTGWRWEARFETKGSISVTQAATLLLTPKRKIGRRPALGIGPSKGEFTTR